MKDTVCIFSGGVDSYTMVMLAHRQGRLHSCLGFDYGQRHCRELGYAAAACKSLGVDYRIIDLKPILLEGLAQSALASTHGSPELPEEHFASDAQRVTCVNNRNMVMLAAAVAYAVTHKLRTVQYGAHAGDRPVYPDCRREFVDAMDTAARLANWEPVRIEAPFLDRDKEDIVRSGLEMGLDYRKAWTCYRGSSVACGVCASCQERLAAFKAAGAQDPMEYETDRMVALESGAD